MAARHLAPHRPEPTVASTVATTVATTAAPTVATTAAPTRRHHNLISWLGLGLALAVVLVTIELHHPRTRPSARQATSLQPAAAAPEGTRRLWAAIAQIGGSRDGAEPSGATASGKTGPAQRPGRATVAHPVSSAPTLASVEAPVSKDSSATQTRARPSATTDASEPSPGVSGVARSDVSTGAPPSPSETTVVTEWDGTLSFPGDVSTAYHFPTRAGTVRVTATWTGGAVLDLRLDCSGGSTATSGPSPLTLGLSASTGACALTIAEPMDERAHLSYELDSEHRTTPPV